MPQMLLPVVMLLLPLPLPLLAAAPAPAPAADVLVRTALGEVRGAAGPTAESFKQLPYAKPPLGELRFAPAQPGAAWAPKTLDAAKPGPPTSCWQSGATSAIDWQAGRKVLYSEDCLTLDLYRPRGHGGGGGAGALLPLLIFVHGGGFTQGAAHEQDGSFLASSQRAIVATVNYRLGPLGFLPSAELTKEPTSRGANGGMNGLRDVIAAIRWLKAHVRAFGGDPERITVMGESSGGIATCTLALSPESAAGLFQRAIVQSGPCIGEWGPGAASLGLELAQEVMSGVGAKTIAELRRVPALNLTDWPDAAYFGQQLFSGFFLDDEGGVMPVPPLERLMAGEVAVETLVIGANTKDGTAQFYTLADGVTSVVPAWNATAGGYHAALVAQYGAAQAGNIAAQYDLREFGGWPSSAFLEGNSDKRLLCPSRTIATLAAAGVSQSQHKPAAGARGASSNSNSSSSRTRVFVYTFAVGPRYNDFLSLNQTGFELVPPSLAGGGGGGGIDDDYGWGAHGTDVSFTFNETGGVLLGDENVSFARPFSAAESVLVDDMMGFWGSVAANGVPRGRVAWPEFIPATAAASGGGASAGDAAAEVAATEVTEVVMRLDLGEKLRPVPRYKADECYFWQTH
jgi:para-nitrobenzyl esterase